MPDETAGPTCSKCGENDVGPGGILCPPCVAAIKAVTLPVAGEQS